jgi:hypothetical protein
VADTKAPETREKMVEKTKEKTIEKIRQYFVCL